MTSKSLATVESSNALTPMDMIHTALDKGLPIEKLLDLQERWEANEAKKAFTAAMNAFKADPPSLTKNKTVGYGKTSYKHISLDHICDVVGASLSEHGLSHRWDVKQTDNIISVSCIITHELGHSVSTSMQAQPDTSGSKNGIQAVGSTVTYLQRYTLLAATGLAAKDQDDDGNGFGGANGPINEVQKAEIIKLIKETGTDTAQFLKFIKQDSVDSIPSGQFDRVIEALQKKRNKQNANS